MAFFRSRKKELASAAKIYSGMRAEVQTLSHVEIFTGKLKVLAEGQAEVHAGPGAFMPQPPRGQSVRLKLYPADGKAFEMIASVTQSGSGFWRFEKLRRSEEQNSRGEERFSSRPSSRQSSGPQEKEENRGAYRQDINVSGSLYATTGPTRGLRVPCKLQNISATGAKVVATRRFHQDDLFQLEVSLVEGDPPFSIPCQVKSVQTLSGIGIPFTQFEYGCQFKDMPQKEQDRLVRMIFTLQRQGGRSGRK